LTFSTSPCGGVFNGPLASISSPNYPGIYPSNVDCGWLLNFEEGSQIEVRNPVMTFPVKKRINMESFIERMAALY